MPVLPEAIATPTLAFCLAALLMPLLNRIAVRTGFVDHPNSRKIHSHPIPLLGGLGVYFGVIVTLALRGDVDNRIMLMMAASFVVMAIGVADDRLDLHSRYRLMLQVGVALGLSAWGVRFNVFPGDLFDHVLTVLWIVGVINAMNCLDCADGAAGGTCVVIFGALAAVAGINGRFFVCQGALAGLGAVLGFLVYNVPPARVFMGDTGSTFLGLMVAVLSILAERSPSSDWHLPLVPFILVVPVADIAWVHVRRYQAGIRSMRDLLSSTGKDHLPHRLMVRGLSKPACMCVVAFLSLLAAAAVYSVACAFWIGAAMSITSLVAFWWHLEEDASVVIRQEDQVALYQVRNEVSAPKPSLRPEESVS
jgi:UDP-GlcNAc:undecaprenyl-phosphate/decaprenyl-phosphate GlcNAc-1-phosphate transferase